MFGSLPLVSNTANIDSGATQSNKNVKHTPQIQDMDRYASSETSAEPLEMCRYHTTPLSVAFVQFSLQYWWLSCCRND